MSVTSISLPPPPLPQLPELLTEDQAAEILGVTPGTLQVWRSCKRYPGLKYVKVGRLVRYRRSDLDAWLASRTVGGSAPESAE